MAPARAAPGRRSWCCGAGRRGQPRRAPDPHACSAEALEVGTPARLQRERRYGLRRDVAPRGTRAPAGLSCHGRETIPPPSDGEQGLAVRHANSWRADGHSVTDSRARASRTPGSLAATTPGEPRSTPARVESRRVGDTTGQRLGQRPGCASDDRLVLVGLGHSRPQSGTRTVDASHAGGRRW